MDVPSKGLEGRDARTVEQNEREFVNAMQFRQVPAVPYKDNKVDTGAAREHAADLTATGG